MDRSSERKGAMLGSCGKGLMAAAALALVSACSSLSSGPFSSSSSVNFAADSSLGAALSPGDRAALADVFVTAMARPAGGSARWSGVSARGVVMPGEYVLANLRSDPGVLMPAPRGLDLTHTVETELGLHVLTRNANIRTGPSTERRVAEVLDAGTGVDVVGKIGGQPWMLIAVDGRVRGYVHSSLVIIAPGAELELAGGPRRRPVGCRRFTQRISVSGRNDEWTGAACEIDGEWRLAPRSAAADGAPSADDELLGL
ncbi:MAG: SH3 domain-containing protein [Pseudomonadota bacterium]